MAQGIFGRRPTFDVPEDIIAMANAPAPKHKLFDRPMLGNILGGVADVVSQHSGFAPTFAPMQAEKRRMSMMEQARAQEMADYEAQQRIAAQYRKQTPYRWESNNGSLMEIGEDGQPRLIYQDPTPKVNWVRADNGDGTFTMVPMSQGGATQPNELDTLPEGYSVRGAGSGQRGFPYP